MEIALAGVALALLAKNNMQAASSGATPHESALSDGRSVHESVWVHNSGNGEGIPISNRFERMTPSLLHSSLGRRLDVAARTQEAHKLQFHLERHAAHPESMLNAVKFVPTYGIVDQMMHDDLHASSLQKQVKSGQLGGCKSSGQIQFEIWNARHKDDPMQRQLLCAAGGN